MKRIPVKNKKAMAAIIMACAAIVSAAGFITWQIVKSNDKSLVNTIAAVSSTLSADSTSQSYLTEQDTTENPNFISTTSTAASTNKTTTKAAPTTSAATREPSVTFAANIEVGSIINFGSYDQDNNLNNGKDKIAWKVLEINNGKALLLSVRVLDCKPYHDVAENTTWEKCTLRKWLNGYFLITAFTANEQKSIVTSTVSNKSPSYWEAVDGNDTQDKVFCLSYDEISKYYYNSYERGASPTAYARGRGVIIYGFVVESGYIIPENSGGCIWWLRTPRYDHDSACAIDIKGNIDSTLDVTYGGAGVRPAIWVNLT